MCQQVAQSLADMFTCKFSFQKCRSACPNNAAPEKAISVAHTGEVAEAKKDIEVDEQRHRMAIIETLLDQLDY